MKMRNNYSKTVPRRTEPFVRRKCLEHLEIGCNFAAHLSYISEITVLELKMGAELSMQRDGINRSQQLEQFLADINILPIYSAIDIAASEKIRLRLAGTPCDDNFDLLIACSAIANGMVCVTDNTTDFHRFQNIQLENWVVRTT